MRAFDAVGESVTVFQMTNSLECSDVSGLAVLAFARLLSIDSIACCFLVLKRTKISSLGTATFLI